MRRANEIDLLEMLRVNKNYLLLWMKKVLFLSWFSTLIFLFFLRQVSVSVRIIRKRHTWKVFPSLLIFFDKYVFTTILCLQICSTKEKMLVHHPQVTNPIYWFSQADYVLIIHIFHDVKNTYVQYYNVLVLVCNYHHYLLFYTVS